MKISESVITRREFLNWSLTASLGALGACVLYPIYKAAVVGPSEPELESVTLKDFSVQEGDGMMFAYGKKPGLLIRKPDGTLKAYSAVCTHFDCTVQYNKSEGVIWCACHNGKYDLNGKVLSGPPPRPLEEYDVAVEGNQVIIAKGKK